MSVGPAGELKNACTREYERLRVSMINFETCYPTSEIIEQTKLMPLITLLSALDTLTKGLRI